MNQIPFDILALVMFTSFLLPICHIFSLKLFGRGFVRWSLSISCFPSDRISLRSMSGELKKCSADLFRGGDYACRCDCQSKRGLWKDNYCN